MRTVTLLLVTLVALTQVGTAPARASTQPLVAPNSDRPGPIAGAVSEPGLAGGPAERPLPFRAAVEEIKKLVGNDSAVKDQFGHGVAISGDTVVIGAMMDDDAWLQNSRCQSGSAYIFERNAGGPNKWGQVKKLTASDADCEDASGTLFGDQFGVSVAISGDTVVVGAHQEQHGCPVTERCLKGAAYVYERNRGGANKWGEVKKLIAPDGWKEDKFGYAVGISGDLIVVGAHGNTGTGRPLDSGAAYVYERDKGGADKWGFVKKLVHGDPQVNDRLGRAVAISGDRVILGAHGKPLPGTPDATFTGAAYLFERDKGGVDNWGQAKKLTASDAAKNDVFGYSVAIYGNTVLVGARGNTVVAGMLFSGAAYVFERDHGGSKNWGQVKRITQSDPQEGDHLGWSVALYQDVALIGAAGKQVPGDPSKKYMGASYVFERNQSGTDAWGESAKLIASDARERDLYGFRVGIDGFTMLVGAPFWHAFPGNETGKAFVYYKPLPSLKIYKGDVPASDQE